jgi:hypothetical protein
MLAVFLAALLAWAKTGNRIAAKITMIAMTTSSSMSVKAFLMTIRIGKANGINHDVFDDC